MPDIIKAVLLGILEGITEFLPISSTGHLIIANEFIGFGNENFENLFNIFIQLGAILSVVVYFRKKLIPLGPGITREKRAETLDLYIKAIAGVLPMILLGVIFKDILEKYLWKWLPIAIALAVGGIAIILIESRRREPVILSVSGLSVKTAVIIGFFQCFAMIPGMSRSACTIFAAMLLGCSRSVAAEFSFFLAIPTMAASSGYALLKYAKYIEPPQLLTLAAGFIVAFIVALVVIRFLMVMISKSSFRPFGIYRIALAAVILLYFTVLKV